MWTPDVQNNYTVVTETLQRRRRRPGEDGIGVLSIFGWCLFFRTFSEW
jgi:hypothetical protein